jgi:hypothetical protein
MVDFCLWLISSILSSPLDLLIYVVIAYKPHITMRSRLPGAASQMTYNRACFYQAVSLMSHEERFEVI